MIHGGNQGGAADEPVAAADRPARVVAHAFLAIANPGAYSSDQDSRSNQPLMAIANDLSGGRPPVQLGNCATFFRKGIPSRTPQQGANP